MATGYRGRIAPSPTGFLHLGHARTFWWAQERARAAQGTLVLRDEDLDRARCRLEFANAMIEDLRWFGLEWQEGPDCGGPHAPYRQSERLPLYRLAFARLVASGHVYPCHCSRRDIREALSAPHAGDEEPIYPGTCRPGFGRGSSREPTLSPTLSRPTGEGARRAGEGTPSRFMAGEQGRMEQGPLEDSPGVGTRPSWRFLVRDGEVITFVDALQGPQRFVAGRDFGDFVVWRQDDLPAYQLACVVDDAAMRITEVVRGADLLVSTARQLLLYSALGHPPPAFCHCPLLTDDRGVRLAKRHDALSLRRRREGGARPADLRGGWELPLLFRRERCCP
jgi:glutamyl-tRNA synthetase